MLPSWDLSKEYPSISSQQFVADYNTVIKNIEKIKGQCEEFKNFEQKEYFEKQLGESENFLKLVNLFLITKETEILFGNMWSYVWARVSNDSTLKEETQKDDELSQLSYRFKVAAQPLSLFFTTSSDQVFSKFISHQDVEASEFYLKEKRKLKDLDLSLKEEKIIAAAQNTSLKSWSDLYYKTISQFKVDVTVNGVTKNMGYGEAYSLINHADPKTRETAWKGVAEAWKNHKDVAAFILNALTDWRLKNYDLRSQKNTVHFLDESLFESKIKKQTLEAMFSALEKNNQKAQGLLTKMAKYHGKNKMDPWDVGAPCPLKTDNTHASVEYDKAIAMIKESFSSISPELSAFVDYMVENKQIDAALMPNKSAGGYCMTFIKSKRPYVNVNYTGSQRELSVLAHELGHAFHSYVLRDVDTHQSYYPMTLAETASIFAETVLMDYMIEKAQTPEEKLQYLWSDLEQAVAFLINIPSRFEFEKELYTQRKNKFFTPDDFDQLMNQSWSKWYGDKLTENDKYFWMTKQHFYMSGIPFYNYPYTFGYLFALSIYVRKDVLGAQFFEKYKEILLNTGRMSCEDLVMKYLNEDITQPQFWQKSIDYVFEKLKQIPN